MKIYTKTGDGGTTGLANGMRIEKDATRMDLIGTIDELNASMGVARVFTRMWREPISKMPRASLNSILLTLQDELFYVGALCAGAQPPPFSIKQKIVYWEKVIDGISAQMPPLHHFILPGGSRVASLLHLSRAVCRRAERLAVRFAKEETATLDPGIIPYLNRLSDLLFVLARWVNKMRGAQDAAWPLEQ